MKIAIASWVNIGSLANLFDQQIPEEIRALGSPATAITNIIRGLHALGHELVVYTLDARTPKKQVFTGERITLVLGKERNRARYKLWDMWKFETTQIQQFCLEYPADIYHAHWSYEYAMGVIRSGRPHLVTFRDDAWEILKFLKDIYRLGRYNLDRKVRAEGRYFSVNSSYLQAQLQSFQSDIPIIPNPVNPAFIRDQLKEIPQNRKVKILSILTGFQKRKNPKKALETFQRVKALYPGEIEYHIIGFGFYEGSEGHQWATENGLTDQVVFHGNVPYDELVDRMPEFDMLFHPALEESFGNTLLEGMASGMPVVAGKDAGAVPWVLDYGRAGYLVDVEDVEAMAEGIVKVLTDADLYDRLVKGGKARVLGEFKRERVAQKYVDYYQEILEDFPKNDTMGEVG